MRLTKNLAFSFSIGFSPQFRRSRWRATRIFRFDFELSAEFCISEGSVPGVMTSSRNAHTSFFAANRRSGEVELVI